MSSKSCNIRHRHIGDQCRFGKSTHISMISNSVTHLRSYTNSAIADIAENSAPISPVTPRDRRRLRIEHRYCRIEWRVFHDVSQCFKSVSWCFTSGSRSFTMYHNVLHVFHFVLLCLTMFSESRNDRRRRIGDRRLPQGSRQRRRDRR